MVFKILIRHILGSAHPVANFTKLKFQQGVTECFHFFNINIYNLYWHFLVYFDLNWKLEKLKNFLDSYCQRCRNQGCHHALSSPIFGRSVHPFPIRMGRLYPPNCFIFRHPWYFVCKYVVNKINILIMVPLEKYKCSKTIHGCKWQ